MKASQKLIEALVRTADKIESGEHYDWYASHSCNCGILAQELGVAVDAPIGAWSNRVADMLSGMFLCPITGRRIKEIFAELESNGVELKDIKDLEHPPGIGHLLGSSRRNDCKVREFTAHYFRKLASQLASQLEKEEVFV